MSAHIARAHSITTSEQAALKLDASTILDTLSYAQNDDADPDRVLFELVEVLKPYCQRRESRRMLPVLLRKVGVEV